MNPQGANGMRGIGHAIVCVRDLDEARATCTRPGLALTPRGGHSLGSSDHLAMFGADYLELLAPSRPGARMFLCQHHTPALVWREPLPSHANGATGLAAVWPFSAPTRRRCARMRRAMRACSAASRCRSPRA